LPWDLVVPRPNRWHLVVQDLIVAYRSAMSLHIHYFLSRFLLKETALLVLHHQLFLLLLLANNVVLLLVLVVLLVC